MPTPPKRLTFAEEMELLKKQKAQAAAQAREQAAQRLQQQSRQPPVNVDALIAAIPAAKTSPTKPANPLGSAPGPVALPNAAALQEVPATPEEAERLRKQKAMEAAFALHVGEHHAKKATGKAGGRQAMLFCTDCRCTTPGEDVEPGSAGIGVALGLLGLVPGVAYFLYRAMASEKQCTHCHSTELVAMNSVQARTLCGEQHAALMENGWTEMRQAEREHTMQRRIAIGKILVVATVVLGASLYILRVPNDGIQKAIAHETMQKQQALRMELRERQADDGTE